MIESRINMEVQHILAHIKYLMDLTPECDFSRNLEHVVEELGEVAKAKRNLRYADRSADEDQIQAAKDHLVEETVDLVITGLATFIAAGGKPNEFYDILIRKCGKWERNVSPQKSEPSSPTE